MRKFKLWNRDKSSYIDLNNQNHFATDWQGLGLGYDLTFSESDNGRYVNNQTISQKDITATLVFTGNAYANYDIIRQFILKNNGRCILEYSFDSAEVYSPWEMDFYLYDVTHGYNYLCHPDIDFSNAYIPTFPKSDDYEILPRNFAYSTGWLYITIEIPIIEAIMAKYDVDQNDAFKIYMQENQYRAYVPTTRTIYCDVIVQELPKAEMTRYHTLESNLKLTPVGNWYRLLQYIGAVNDDISVECKYPNTPIYMEISNINMNDFSVHLLGDIYATEIHFNASLTSDLTLVIDSYNRKIYTKSSSGQYVENWYQYIDHNLDSFLIMPEPGYYTVTVGNPPNGGNIVITIREMV